MNLQGSAKGGSGAFLPKRASHTELIKIECLAAILVIRASVCGVTCGTSDLGLLQIDLEEAFTEGSTRRRRDFGNQSVLAVGELGARLGSAVCTVAQDHS